jgi:outer membrane protein assembly factor BamA
VRARAETALLAILLARAAVGEPVRITEIEIRMENVFSPSEAAASFVPYGLANALHAVSRKSLIRKFLLFDVGDPIDPELFAETERNLRATGLFRYVLVRYEGTKVIVETGDAWTLLLRGAFSSKGGVTSYQIGAEEANLLGTGRQLKFLYDNGTQRISRSFTFADPAFLHPYTLLNLVYSNLSDGTFYQAGVQRSFYALDTPWAAGAAYQQARFLPKVYAGGDEAATYSERQLFFRADGGLRASLSETTANRALGFLEFTDTTVTAGPFGPPPLQPSLPRRFFFIGTGVEREARGWIQRTDVDKIGRVEDFNLAPVGQIQLGLSPEIFGATGAARLTVRGSMGTLLPSGFSLATVSGEVRYENGPQNAIVNVDLRAILQIPDGTLVARIGLASGWRLDPELQIYLDGETGVRAYRLHAVSATGRLVGNFELRRVFFHEVLHLVSIGTAVFFDTGVSWGPPDGNWRLADAGVGLRFGLTRASQMSLLRLDVARAFNPDPLGRTGWLVSFASSQAF